MNTHDHSVRSRRLWLSGSVLIASLVFTTLLSANEEAAKQAAEDGRKAAAQAAEHVEAYTDSTTDLNKAEVKAALADLDAQIEELESLATHAPDEAKRQAAEVRLDALKERRDAIRADFNQARFAALRADVRREWTAFRTWIEDKTDGVDEEGAQVARTDDPEPAPRGEGEPVDGGHILAPETAAAPIVARGEDRDGGEVPAETGDDEQRAALARVDEAIARLESQLAEGDETGAQHQATLGEFRQERAELARKFSADRYRELIDDIEARTQQLERVAE